MAFPLGGNTFKSNRHSGPTGGLIGSYGGLIGLYRRKGEETSASAFFIELGIGQCTFRRKIDGHTSPKLTPSVLEAEISGGILPSRSPARINEMHKL